MISPDCRRVAICCVGMGRGGRHRRIFLTGGNSSRCLSPNLPNARCPKGDAHWVCPRAEEGSDAETKAKYFYGTKDRAVFGTCCTASKIHCHAENSSSHRAKIRTIAASTGEGFFPELNDGLRGLSD